MKKIVCILLMLGSSLKVMTAQAAQKDASIYDELISMHLEDEKPLARKLKTLHKQDARIPQLADIAQYNINHYGDENINWHKVIEHAQQIALDPQGYIDQNNENNNDDSVYLYADDSDKDNDENEEEYYYGQEEYEFQEAEEKEVDPRQIEIDLALKNHPDLVQGFFICFKELGSFKDFLKQHLANDNEDVNFGEVIAQAKEALYQALVKKILRVIDLDSSYFDNESYRTLSSAIDYIINHKDVNELEHRELLEELFKGITSQSSVYEVIGVIKDPSLKKLLMYIKSQEQEIVEQTSPIDYNFESFIQAIKDNKVSVVKRLLELHKFNLSDSGMSQNPLYVAVDNGCTEIVRLLLAQPGINVNGSDISQKPLYANTSEFHSQLRKIVKLLVEEPGIELDNSSMPWFDNNIFKMLSGFNPLYAAARKGYTDIVELLLVQQGINVNGLGASNPLYAAAGNGHIEIVKLLLAQPGIDVNGLQKFNPLYTTDKKSLFFEAATLNVTQFDISLNPLYAAVGRGHIEIVKLLLAQAGIDVSGLGEFNLLHVAVVRGDRDMVELLLAQPRIDVNGLGRFNPLYTAAMSGYREIVELLLEHPEIDVNRGNNNDSPLCKAARNGHTDIVNLLLAHPGIDVNRGNNNDSLLCEAVRNGHTDIVELLVAHPGIDVNKKCQSFNQFKNNPFKNKRFTTPLGIAIKMNREDIALLLRNAGAHK